MDMRESMRLIESAHMHSLNEGLADKLKLAVKVVAVLAAVGGAAGKATAQTIESPSAIGVNADGSMRPVTKNMTVGDKDAQTFYQALESVKQHFYFPKEFKDAGVSGNVEVEYTLSSRGLFGNIKKIQGRDVSTVPTLIGGPTKWNNDQRLQAMADTAIEDVANLTNQDFKWVQGKYKMTVTYHYDPKDEANVNGSVRLISAQRAQSGSVPVDGKIKKIIADNIDQLRHSVYYPKNLIDVYQNKVSDINRTDRVEFFYDDQGEAYSYQFITKPDTADSGSFQMYNAVKDLIRHTWGDVKEVGSRGEASQTATPAYKVVVDFSFNGENSKPSTVKPTPKPNLTPVGSLSDR